MGTNNSTAPLYVTMKNRMEWLWEWVKMRDYDLETNDKRNTFLYIYYITLFQGFGNRNFAFALTNKRNRQLSKPLNMEEFKKKVALWQQPKYNRKFTNETIIRLLGITEEEAEILEIGKCKREKAERALRTLQRRERNFDILLLRAKGLTQKEIAEHLEVSISTVKRILRESRNFAKGSLLTITEVPKGKSALTEFVSPEAERLYSLYKEETEAAPNDEFAIALEKLKTSSNNLFICGSAGTGKSSLIKEYLESLTSAERKRVLLVAPTGKAADLINGITIHKAFELPSCVQTTDTIEKLPKALNNISTVIIDEISMVRVDVFSKIMQILQFADRHIRLIVLGDFGQLRPVATKSDKTALKMLYPNTDSYYAFNSEYWDAANFEKITLHKIMRQNDAELIEHLNGIKYGRVADIEWFNSNTSPFIPAKPIYICSRCKTVDEFNQSALDEFKQDNITTTYKAKYTGKLTADLPCPKELEIGVGVRVMTICNDTKYKNGNIGTVKAFTDDGITVKFDNDKTATVKRKSFELENGTEYTQFPLVLAYAVTVHRSQGSTFNNVVIICEEFFEAGMLYTALSRCRSIYNISFIGRLKPKDLKIDTEALKMTVNRTI